MLSLPLPFLVGALLAPLAQTPPPEPNQFFQFEVGDLVNPPPSSHPAGPASFHPDYDLEGLASLIRRGIRPALDATQGSLHSIEPDHLVLVGSAEQGDWVSHFLALQREPGQGLLFEIHLLRAPRGGFAAFGLSGPTADGAGDAKGRRPVIFPDSEGFLALLEKCLQGPGVKTLADMKMVSRLGQRATISTMNEINYVLGYEKVRVEPGGRLLLDPKISQIEEGNQAEVLGVLLDPLRVSLQVHLIRSEVERPLRSLPGPPPLDPAGNPLPPPVSPVLHSAELTSSLELPSHGAAVWVTHDVDDEHDLAFLLQVSAERIAAEGPK